MIEVIQNVSTDVIENSCTGCGNCGQKLFDEKDIEIFALNAIAGLRCFEVDLLKIDGNELSYRISGIFNPTEMAILSQLTYINFDGKTKCLIGNLSHKSTLPVSAGYKALTRGVQLVDSVIEITQMNVIVTAKIKVEDFNVKHVEKSVRSILYECVTAAKFFVFEGRVDRTQLPTYKEDFLPDTSRFIFMSSRNSKLVNQLQTVILKNAYNLNNYISLDIGLRGFTQADKECIFSLMRSYCENTGLKYNVIAKDDDADIQLLLPDLKFGSILPALVYPLTAICEYANFTDYKIRKERIFHYD